MWSKAAVTAHQRALATAKKWDDAIRRLEEMAKHAPQLRERVQELRDLRDQAEMMSGAALAVDSQGS